MTTSQLKAARRRMKNDPRYRKLAKKVGLEDALALKIKKRRK